MLPNIVRLEKWVSHVALKGERRNIYTVLVGKLLVKCSLGKQRKR